MAGQGGALMTIRSAEIPPAHKSASKNRQGLSALFLSSSGARITSYIVGLIGWIILAEMQNRVPGPWKVLNFLWAELTGGSHGGVLKGEWFEHMLFTLQRFGIGLVIAFLAGLSLGILIGSSRYFHALMNDTLLVLLALPAVIWAFLTVIWFGLGWKAPVWTVALSAAPFVAVNVSHGVRAITPELYLMSASFAVPWKTRIRHLVLPALTGHIFAGLRFAVIIGWNGVLLAEWFGSAEGVGWRTRYWYDANRYEGFVGWVAMFIIFIVLLDRMVLTPIQKRAFRWRDIGDADNGPTSGENELTQEEKTAEA